MIARDLRAAGEIVLYLLVGLTSAAILMRNYKGSDEGTAVFLIVFAWPIVWVFTLAKHYYLFIKDMFG